MCKDCWYQVLAEVLRIHAAHVKMSKIYLNVSSVYQILYYYQQKWKYSTVQLRALKWTASVTNKSLGVHYYPTKLLLTISEITNLWLWHLIRAWTHLLNLIFEIITPEAPQLKHVDLKNSFQGFPCGAVVERPPANAGDTGSIPGPGRSHMLRCNWARAPQLLSPRATTTEARAPRARAPHQERPPQWEARGDRNEVWPLLAETRESPRAATKTQCSQK